MTVENKYEIKVNIKSNTFRTVPEVVANDHVVFEVEVWDGPSKFTLSTDYTYRLTSMKKSGTAVIRDGVLAGEVVVFNLGTSEMTEPGKVEGTVQIYDANDNRISSSKFDYLVKEDPSLQGSLPADNTSLIIANESLLTQSVEKSDQAIADSSTALTKATAAETTANDVRSEFDLVVAEAGSSNPEVVQARDTFVNLKARLDSTDNLLAETMTDLEQREVNIKQPPFNIKGDGTDETVILLNALNYVADNHFTLFIPKELTITIDTITVLNKHNFGIRCEGTIKRLNNSPTIGALLKLDTCSNVFIPEINLDGNGLNNGCVENVAYTVTQEQKHSMILLKCSRITIDRFYALNSCGDGIYISGNSKDIKMGTVTGKADTQIGRNLVSLINCQDINIDYLYSDNVGHFDMPGGLDIEPNGSTETVKNVLIGKINITSGGTNPFSIMATNGSTVENIFIDSVNIVRTNVIAPTSEITTVYLTGNNVRIGKLSVKNLTLYNINFIGIVNQGITPKGITVQDAYSENCYRGIILGQGTSAVEDIKIKATMRNLKHDGVIFYTCKNVELTLDIDSVGSTRFMVNKPSGGGVAENVRISGDFTKRGTGTCAFISGDVPSNIVNWVLKNLDFTGWGNDARLNGGGWQGSVRKESCPNLTHLPSKPNFEQWKIGDIVYNTNPVELGTTGSKYIVDKWIATANGTGSVAFKESRTLTGS